MSSDTYRTIRRDGSLNVRPRRQGVSFGDLYHDLLRVSWATFVIWFAVAFLLINCTFGSVYFLLSENQFEGLRHVSGWERWVESFFFSVQTMGTIGYGKVSPVGFAANAVVTVECYTGIFVVALMTGLIFSRFSRPYVKVEFSRNAVIKPFDGVPCLMFRIANERQNHITDALVRLYLVIDDPKTGYREFTELQLERNESPLFSLSWTIAHDINPSSPLHGLSFEELKKRHAEFVVSFRGKDTTLSQELHAKYSYIAEEILPNHDFVDVIKRHEDHSISLQMEKFHEVRPLVG